MRPSQEPTEELDEHVHLADWDPAWPVRALGIAHELVSLCGRAESIEHIGSTAVEGMRAKPVIDVMVGAIDEAQQNEFASRLADHGWTDMGEAGVPGRRHLRQRSVDAANVHIVLLGSLHWVNNLAVRDFLRAHPEERKLYTQRKEASIADGAHRLLAYSDRKKPAGSASRFA